MDTTSVNMFNNIWKRFGARVNADAQIVQSMSQANAKGVKTAAGPGVAGGIILAGYGIWKMATAKEHVDQLCKQIECAKTEMLKETAASHEQRPGDSLIRQAFDGLTQQYYGAIQPEWDADLHEFITEYPYTDCGNKSRQVEKRALATMGRLKGHLRRIEGLFTGFQNNLQQAFQVNQTFQGDVKDMKNARGHDTWKTIAFSIAAVGLSAVAGFSTNAPATASSAVGAGIAAFGGKQQAESMQKIKAYQTSMRPYAQLVQQDMKETGEMMALFH